MGEIGKILKRKSTVTHVFEYDYKKDNGYFTSQTYGINDSEQPIKITFIDKKYSDLFLPFNNPYTINQLAILSDIHKEVEKIKNNFMVEEG